MWANSADSCQCFIYYPVLPVDIASHFDVDGNVDSYLPKFWFFVVYISMITFFNLLFHTLACKMNRLPTKCLNIPRKDYWFANEENKKRLFNMLSAYFIWFAMIETFFFYGIMQLVFSANYDDPSQPVFNVTIFFILLITFLVLILGGIIFLIIKLTKRNNQIERL